MAPIDSGSEGENGEKPVRERLKQTSIAKPREDGADDHQASDAASDEAGDDANGDPPLRPTRKRSFEDMGKPEPAAPLEDAANDKSSTHLRKRTKEVAPTEDALASQMDDASSDKDDHDATNGGTETPARSPTPPKNTLASPARRDALLSPRKKRSRESVDAADGDGGREQKIPSTEETRARRSSSEERPGQGKEGKADAKAAPASKQQENASGSTPIFGEALKPKPLEKKADPPQTSSSAFAASGFASLAGSSSGFGSFGASPASAPKLFGNSSPASGFASQGASKPATFGSSAAAPASGFASAGAKSAFGGTLAPSAFGGGFGGGFGSGGKLSSFAAPVGDANLNAKAADKPFGATKDEADNDSDGSSEGDGDADDEAPEQKEREESSTKYKVQEVRTGEDDEDSVFSNRGKLFQFHANEKAWKERGVGSFKVNVQRPDAQEDSEDGEDGETNGTGSEARDQAHTKARFIMRNQATHKIILNTPIYKEMSVKEQSGKQLVFLCPNEAGEITSYTLRMGKEEDIKRLLRLVQDLQDRM